jgi:two-component system LytT family response regulator
MTTTILSIKKKHVACALLRVGRNTRCFPIRDIVRLEASSNYTYIHFINHRPILIAKVMRLLEESLQPHGFIRIHRRHLINTALVIGIDDGKILLKDDSRIPYSRRKKRIAMQAEYPTKDFE